MARDQATPFPRILEGRETVAPVAAGSLLEQPSVRRADRARTAAKSTGHPESARACGPDEIERRASMSAWTSMACQTGTSRSSFDSCAAPRGGRGTCGWRTETAAAAADVSPHAAARHAGQGAVGQLWPLGAPVAPRPSGAQPRWFPPPPHLVTPDACRHGSRRHATRRPLPLNWSRPTLSARARRMRRGGAPGRVRKTYRFHPPLPTEFWRSRFAIQVFGKQCFLDTEGAPSFDGRSAR